MSSALWNLRTRILSFSDDLKTSYWFLPILFAVASISLSQILLGMDRMQLPDNFPLKRLLYTGSADGARLILSTIAGSMIGITGVVFSITMVTLALASKQFGPRLLRNFMRDRLNQVILGTFILTFIYCVLIFRSLHDAGEGNYEKFIPQISMFTAVIFAGASIGVLIYYIHHIATSIQAPFGDIQIADRTA